MTDQPKKQHYTDDKGREWIRFTGKPSMLVAISKSNTIPGTSSDMQFSLKHKSTYYHFEITELASDADLARASRNLKHLAKWYLHTVLLPG